MHHGYPLSPKKIKDTKDMLSDYAKNIVEKYQISTGLVHKLIQTLKNKEKYVLHYRNLNCKFKDETLSIPITEFIGLRSKMYSYIKKKQ